MKKLFAATLVSVGLMFVVIGAYKINPPVTYSPLATRSPLSTPYTKSHIIYGFLPYWNLKKDLGGVSHLTHVAYFALEPNEDGSIKKFDAPGVSNLGWYWLQQPSTDTLLHQIRQSGVQTDLVLTLFESNTLEMILASPLAQEKLVNDLLAVVDQHGFNGINLDFEPREPLSLEATAQFSHFLQRLRHVALSHFPKLLISLDVIGRAALNPSNYPLSTWQASLDYVIVMAYDYHPKSSSIAGPVAPLYASLPSKDSIMRNLSQFQAAVPLEKVILGMPLYGYQWQTTTNAFKSPTFPRSGLAVRFEDLADYVNQPNSEKFWDPISQTPWITHADDDQLSQLYFENTESILRKIYLVKESSLAGISVWALGYDGDDQDLWQAINQLNMDALNK